MDNDNTVDVVKIEVEGEDKSATSTLDKVLAKLERIKKAGLSGGTKDIGSRVVTSDSVSKLDKFRKKLSDIKGNMKSVSTTASSVGSKIKQAFSVTPVGRFVSKVKGIVSAIGRIVMYRVIRSMIKQVTDAFATGINNMYQYSLLFQGSFSNAMDRAASSMLSFKNSVASAVAPLIEFFIPYLDKAVDKLMEINNTIAMVFAGLTGKSTYSRAVRVTTSYADSADKASKNTDKLKDSVTKLSRSFAGLDEITVIGDNYSDKISSLADTVADNTPDYSTMFVETPVDMAKVDEFKEKLKDILVLAGLIGAAITAWKFTKALTGASGLSSALTLAGIALTITGATLIFKGIKDVVTDGMDWTGFWKLFFGSAATTAGAAVLGGKISQWFGGTFGKGAGIGARVGAGVGGAAMLFSGMYDTLTNTLDSGKGNLESSLTSYFSSVIGGALLGTAIAPGIGTAIGAVGGAIVDGISFYLSNPKSVEQVKNALQNGTLGDKVKVGLFFELTENMGFDSETSAKITNWFTNNWVKPMQDMYNTWDSVKTWASDTWNSIKDTWNSAGSWIETNVTQPIGNFFSGLWDGIKNIWSSAATWFDTNFIQPVSGFFSGLWTGVSQLGHDAWVIITAVWQTVSGWFNEHVITPVSNFFSGLWKSVSGLFTGLWDDVKGVWNSVATWFNDNVVVPIGDFFSGLWTSVSGFFTGLWDDIKGVWDSVSTWFDQNVIQPVSDAFETVTSTISGFFSDCWTGIKNAAATAINWVIGGIEGAINGMIGGVNWFIDKFNSIGEWASNVTGMTFYYVSEIQPVSLGRIQTFKEGGFPEDGFFYANHNELVGQFSNGRTAVANNEQIVEGISNGVSQANEETNSLLRENNRLMRLLLSKDSSIDVSTIASAFNRQNRRDGKVTVPVSV